MTTATPTTLTSPREETPLPALLAQRDTVRLRRYHEYLDYHEGRRGAPPARVRRSRERALVLNYARSIVEKGASYLVTEHHPVVTAAPSDAVAAEAEQLLRNTWDANNLARLDIETEVDTAVLGDGAYKVTWDPDAQQVVVSAPDVQGLHAWWAGDDVRRTWRVASRYHLEAAAFQAVTGHPVRTIAGQRPQQVEVVESCTADTFDLWADGHLIKTRENPTAPSPSSSSPISSAPSSSGASQTSSRCANHWRS